MSIEDSTASKPSFMFWFWRSNTGTESPSYAETIKIGKSISSMDFMTSVSKNMEPNLFGSFLLRFLHICHSLPLSKIKYFAFTVDYPLKSSSWTKLNLSIESKISLIKGLSAIYFGQILLTKEKWVSGHRFEVLASVGGKILVINSLIGIILKWFAEHINL